MSEIITLTDEAVAHIKKMAEKVENAKGFRLSLKKTGCSGFAYVPDIISQVNENDFHFIAQQELHIYVDRDHENFLRDTVIDYVADNIGLKQKRLVFINPQEKNRCGCGESFTTE